MWWLVLPAAHYLTATLGADIPVHIQLSDRGRGGARWVASPAAKKRRAPAKGATSHASS